MNVIDEFHNWRRKLRWNRQYRSGRWERLKEEIESRRYQKIIDDIILFGNKNPSILDLGCGEGILCERMRETEYSHFLGIDFSSVSIKKASNLKLKNVEFLCADIHKFRPKQKFDVIIFNEVFYYINRSEKQNVLNRMIEGLTENGIIITSIYRERASSWEFFDNSLKQLDFTTIHTNDKNSYWKIGVYKK